MHMPSVRGYICSYNIQRHINPILLNRCRYSDLVQELLPVTLQTFSNINNRQIAWTAHSKEFRKNERRFNVTMQNRWNNRISDGCVYAQIHKGLGMHLVTYSNHDTVTFLLIVPKKGWFIRDGIQCVYIY